MGISAAEMSRRMSRITQEWLQNQTNEIILKDGAELKKEKISELEQGLIIDGKEKRAYRNKEYALMKQQMNPMAGGAVDLIFTGQTSSTLFVHPYGRGYIMDFKDRYNLVGKYGFGIHGLNQNWFNQRQKDVYTPLLLKKVIEQLN